MGRRLGFWPRFAVATSTPVLHLMTRRDWSGAEHIPAGDGVIIVPNHISHCDPLVVAHFVYAAGRWPQFLGKVSVFEVPLLGRLMYAVHQIPVRRGTADAVRALEAAVVAVRGGAALIIYPEGTITREPELWPMRGKTGVARLWLSTGAPVIPVVMWGPERFFDVRTQKLRLHPRTPVTVAAGPPVDLSRWTGAEPTADALAAITDEVMLRVRDMLAAVRRRTPPPLYDPTPDGAEGSAPVPESEEQG